LGEDFFAVVTGEAESDLGAEQTELDSEIVATTWEIVGEVPLAVGEGVEGGRQLELAVFGFGTEISEDVHEAGGEDVHAEEAEIMGGAQAGDDEVLFGFSGGWFFDDVVD
jgi:hypothetical protein